MTPSSVKVQISPASVPSTPSWFGEVTLIAHVFTQRGWLWRIVERVRFARARFGTYDTIDFVVVLLGYAVSGERTLKAFYEHLQPLGEVFMSLFGRASLPSRSALSQYLAALDQGAVEALRTLFLEDLGACRSLGQGGLYDREGTHWVVIDVDATRAAARQRALPHGPALPVAHRRMDALTASGYTGRKRGEVVRSRTTVLQAHMQSWLGTNARSRQWGLSWRIAPCHRGDHHALSGLVHPPLTSPDPLGWIVWQCGSPQRSSDLRSWGGRAWERLYLP